MDTIAFLVGGLRSFYRLGAFATLGLLSISYSAAGRSNPASYIFEPSSPSD